MTTATAKPQLDVTEAMKSQAVPATEWRRAPVSVVILTLNEEINIAEAIASSAWSDDVHVLDSGSTDRTCEIAQELGIKVHVHPFRSFGAQRNWAIDNIPLKYNWVFHLDADERFTQELVSEMDETLLEEPFEAGFQIPNKLIFQGRWLRFSAGYPTYQMRLFHKERMRFRDYGHGQREATDGKVGFLKSPYLHYSFSKGLYDWLDKHNRYSSLEALQTMQHTRSWAGFTNLFSRDAIKRRRAWKDLGYSLPFRPFVRWFYTMFISLGVLDGSAGWTYARLLAMYEQMTVQKLRLLKSRRAAAREDFEKDTTPQVKTKLFVAGDEQVDRLDGKLRTDRHPDRSQIEPVPAHYYMGEDEGRELGQLAPESSPWTFKEKAARVLWMLVAGPIFRVTFHNWYGLRVGILRIFGAQIGHGVRIRPTVKIEVPWNLDLRDSVTVGDYAILYALGKITICERTTISQYAHLCAGTHDFTNRRFPLIRDPIWLGPDVWIGADVFVGPDVKIGRLSVVGARSSVYKDLEPGMVYVGNPAKAIKQRELH